MVFFYLNIKFRFMYLLFIFNRKTKFVNFLVSMVESNLDNMLLAACIEIIVEPFKCNFYAIFKKRL